MELIKADEMPRAFQSMFNLYAHDLSEYNPWIGTQIDKNGNFLVDAVREYFDNSSFEAYCIVEKDKPAGMVVFSSEECDGECCYVVEEIFLIKTSFRNS